MKHKSGATPHIPRWESAFDNNLTFNSYYQRLTDMALSFFEWENLPETINERYLEYCLYTKGQVVFFYDDVLGYLCLPVTNNGQLDVYHDPIHYYAWASTGYRKELDQTNSVIIYNNFIRQPSQPIILEYANKLMRIERAIDVNLSAQRTPILIRCGENQRLSLKNLYQKYDGNEPFIFGEKGFDPESIQVLNTGAPYLCDKFQVLKRQYWNEALTFVGINNANTEKKERLVEAEVSTNLGGVRAAVNTRLASREIGRDKINNMFPLNINVKVRGNIDEIVRELIADVPLYD